MRGINIAVVGFDDAECKDLSDLISGQLTAGAHLVLNLSSPHRLIPALESGIHVDVLYLSMGDEPYPAMALDLARSVVRTFPWVQIVFWSSHADHIMQAYAVPHSFFLLRPFTEQFVERFLEESFRRLRDEGDRPFGLKIGSSMAKLRPSQVLYAESNRHKVLVHMCGGHELEAYLRLAQLAEFLPQSFVQIHKSFLVNMNHAVSFDAKGVEMADGAVIPVSQSRRKEVRDAFAQSCSFVRGPATL